MKSKRKNLAVSEVIGIVLLLGMSIALFSVLQIIVYAYPFEQSSPSVNLVGSVVNDSTPPSYWKIFIEHHGGEPISINSSIIVNIEGYSAKTFTAYEQKDITTFDNDDNWEIGEIVSYTPVDSGFFINLDGLSVSVSVIDTKSNSIVMTGFLQEAN